MIMKNKFLHKVISNAFYFISLIFGMLIITIVIGVIGLMLYSMGSVLWEWLQTSTWKELGQAIIILIVVCILTFLIFIAPNIVQWSWNKIKKSNK